MMVVVCCDKYLKVLFSLGLIFTVNNVFGSSSSDEPTRKFDASAFFKSVAKTCTTAGDAVAAKTKEEKQKAACDLVGSVCETAAVLSEKTKTRSLGYEYLQTFIALPTDEEREAYIVKILTKKEEATFFLNELFGLTKVLLVEELPFFIDVIHQDTVANLNINEK